MQEQLFEKYLRQFLKLRRAPNNGGAPHKPVLLLAIFKQIEKGNIQDYRISITTELVTEFKSIWNHIVVTDHQPRFFLPFFHLRSEPFWSLISSMDLSMALTASNSPKSMSALQDAVAYAEMDKELFGLLLNPVFRIRFENELLAFYFNASETDFKGYHDLADDINNQIVEEDTNTYSARVLELEKVLPKEEFEEEIFMRKGSFRKIISLAYNDSCCVTGLNANGVSGASFIDACHIVPFAQSHDDTVRNGIALNPTLHRAFDRGLLTLNDQFQVRISPLLEKDKGPYSLHQFEGQTVRLPENEKWYPSIENLKWHRANVYNI